MRTGELGAGGCPVLLETPSTTPDTLQAFFTDTGLIICTVMLHLWEAGCIFDPHPPNSPKKKKVKRCFAWFGLMVRKQIKGLHLTHQVPWGWGTAVLGEASTSHALLKFPFFCCLGNSLSDKYLSQRQFLRLLRPLSPELPLRLLSLSSRPHGVFKQ